MPKKPKRNVQETSPAISLELLTERAFERRDQPLRASGISLYYECPRKYWLMKLAGLFPPLRPVSSAITTGTIFHTIMEKTFQEAHKTGTFDLSKGIALAEVEVNSENQRLAALWETLSNPDHQDQCKDQITTNTRSFLVARAMATVYWEAYPPLFTPDDVVLIEKEVTGYFANIPIAGRIDYAARAKPSPKSGVRHYYLFDYKTTAQSPEAVLAGRSYDAAFIIYNHLARKILSRRCIGMTYNVIQRPTIRFCRKDKTFEDYVKRVKTWYKDAEHEPFTSFFVPYNLTTALEQEFIQLCSPIIKASSAEPDNPAWWPRRCSSCSSFGSLCPYYTLCNAESAAALDHALQNYRLEERK